MSSCYYHLSKFYLSIDFIFHLPSFRICSNNIRIPGITIKYPLWLNKLIKFSEDILRREYTHLLRVGMSMPSICPNQNITIKLIILQALKHYLNLTHHQKIIVIAILKKLFLIFDTYCSISVIPVFMYKRLKPIISEGSDSSFNKYSIMFWSPFPNQLPQLFLSKDNHVTISLQLLFKMR